MDLSYKVCSAVQIAAAAATAAAATAAAAAATRETDTSSLSDWLHRMERISRAFLFHEDLSTQDEGANLEEALELVLW